MTYEPPPPPERLGRKGCELWREMTARLMFEMHELPLLTLACEQADVVEQLEAVVEREGWIVPGATGQPRLNPAIAEARQARQAVAKLLAQVPVPDGDDESLTPAQRRGRKAANTRWASHRSRTGR